MASIQEQLISSAVTIVVAFTAWGLYLKQKRDQRKDAAGIILREIEQAERNLPAARRAMEQVQKLEVPEKCQVMPISSWKDLQYQLSRELPPDVMERIDEFYSNCKLLDEALSVLDAIFYKNESEVRVNQFRIIADILYKEVSELKPNPQNDPEVNEENNIISQKYSEQRKAIEQRLPTLTSYQANKPANDAEKYLQSVPSELSLSRVGQALRKAKSGLFSRIFSRKRDQ